VESSVRRPVPPNAYSYVQEEISGSTSKFVENYCGATLKRENSFPAALRVGTSIDDLSLLSFEPCYTAYYLFRHRALERKVDLPFSPVQKAHCSTFDVIRKEVGLDNFISNKKSHFVYDIFMV
jgi:hypothetical protein